MAEKSRQHYVPKFYLRNFSNTKKSIDTFNINNLKYISNASIKDMCQKHNFYGADKKMENFLNEDIETKAASIIRNILNTSRLPDMFSYDHIHLVMFLLVSEARNLKSAESTNNMVDYMAKTLLKGHSEFSNEDLEKFKVEMTEPANYHIQLAIDSTELVMDLKPLLIINKSGARGFITSDNPVVRHNMFYNNKKYIGGTGLMTRGLQFFFPISPDKCILLYDSVSYNIPGEKDYLLTLNRAKDIDVLNELFYLNAYNNVFFNQRTKRDYITGIYSKNKRTPMMKNLNREIATFESVNTNGEIISFSQNKVQKNLKFSWINISNVANNLMIPNHMGGLQRIEWPPINEQLHILRARFEKDNKPIYERFVKKD